MKKILLTSVMIALVVVSYSQAPQAFNYQAILRNTDGTFMANETVVLQISIIHGHTDGPPVYLEIHNTQTNELGQVNLIIGKGTTTDDISTVDWSNGPHFLEITVDGEILGASPLLSVPYALYAKTAENVTETIVETDPVFGSSIANSITEIDTANWNNNLSVEVDGDPKNELQQISISNDTIYLSNGGYVVLANRNLLINSKTNNVTCVGETDGSIDITIAGGNSPYTYLWNNGSNLEDLTNLGKIFL